MTATDRLIATTHQTTFADIPPPAREAACKFLLDAAGTALSGTGQSHTPAVLAAAGQWGTGECTVIGHKRNLSVAGAVVANGFLVHNQEFDGVHETAIVHPMAVILPVLLAEADGRGTLSGEDAILAAVIALDIAVNIGLSATSPVSFYRQGMCAALGATAGAAKVRGLDLETTRTAIGHCYGQLSGTMQAHSEGSVALPMQMGFNARAVIGALDLAEAGVPAPLDVIEGRFGYFALMEESWSPDTFDSIVGQRWRITELSHKPWPTGRATHACLDVLLNQRIHHDLDPANVRAVEVAVPALVARLVDRPATTGMAPNYARLCLPYVAACALLDGEVGVNHFDPASVGDERRLKYAERIRVRHDSAKDPNSLSPQTITLRLANGDDVTIETGVLPGHPDQPLSREQWTDKFRACCRTARNPLENEHMDELLFAFEHLAEIRDFSDVARMLSGRGNGT